MKKQQINFKKLHWRSYRLKNKIHHESFNIHPNRGPSRASVE